MVFFLPSFWQKRILRFALSHIELLDIDALDLDKLDIALGKKSTVELRDVGVRLDKLPALLQLPGHVKVNKARVLLVRLHVPSDIYNSGILLEVEGVHVEVAADLNTRPERPEALARAGKSNVGTAETGRRDDDGRRETFQARRVPRRVDISTVLPSASDLAESFLETEPKEEKEQLKAALSRSYGVDQSQLSESGDDESGDGLGGNFSMPRFVADFLSGVVDRIHAVIKEIRLDVHVSLDTGLMNPSPSPTSSPETVILRLSVAQVQVGQVHTKQMHLASPESEKAASEAGATIGNRRILIKAIEGMLFTDASVFSWLAHYSGPPSPSVTQSTISRKSEKEKRSPSSSDEASSTSETGLGLAQSSFVEPNPHRSDHSPKLASEKHSMTGLQSSDAYDESLSDSVDSAGYRSFRHDDTDQEHQDIQGSQFESAYYEQESLAEAMDDSDPDIKAVEGAQEQSIGTEISVSRPVVATQSPSRSSKFGDQYIPMLEAQFETDNLRFGLESQRYKADFDPDSGNISSPDPDIFDHTTSIEEPLAQTASESVQDLTESRVFTHEEAESMYQSAVSQAPAVLKTFRPMPGQWSDDEDVLGQHERSATPTNERPALGGDGNGSSNILDEESRDSIYAAQDSSSRNTGPASSISSNPRAIVVDSPANSSGTPFMKKQFFTVDLVQIDLPAKDGPSPQPSTSPEINTGRSSDPLHDLPGGFSQSFISTDSHHASIHPQQHPPASQNKYSSTPIEQNKEISISIRDVQVLCDMGLARLTLLAFQQFAQLPKPQKAKESQDNTADALPMSLKLESFQWNLLSSLKGQISPATDKPDESERGVKNSESEILLSLNINAVSFNQRHLQGVLRRDVRIGRFSFGYKDDAIVEFDSSLRMRASTRDVLAPVDQDIHITMKSTSNSASEITIMTLPIHVSLDLTRLDDTFTWLGGLSGMLELGNSMMSTMTVTETKSKANVAARTGRTVRFQSPAGSVKSTPTLPSENLQTKTTARIGGLVFDLHGKDHSISVEGSAVKIVSRSEGIGVRIDKLRVEGPTSSDSHTKPAINARFGVLKLEYLQFPAEQDLDRLLALLSPSSEQDEEPDEDIIIDTLFRQRRQGGVLRVGVDTIKGSIGNLREFDKLLALTEELKKLSTVAKYLPEDDRPGVLTLARIGQVNLTTELQSSFGIVDIATSDIEVGHVSFPALLLLGVGALNVSHGSQSLVGEVLASTSPELRAAGGDAQQHPTITARLVGDDLEPTLKIRLRNLRIDYHVTTVMALLGITETVNGEVIVNDLVQSVANLAPHSKPPKLTKQSSSRSNESSLPKSLKFDVKIQDTALSLNPRRSSAQGLLVFTDANLLGNVPKDSQSDFQGSLDIKRMSVLIVDDVSNIHRELSQRSLGSQPAGRREQDQVDNLQAMGYISVSDISSASIGVTIITSSQDDERCVEVNVRDDLFVLETCADSTHTLQTILNGLSPPLPPKKELKYRTEVVPVQDMLASITGDAFATDVTEEDDTDYRSQLHEEDFVEDDLPNNLEYVSGYLSSSSVGGGEDSFMSESNLSTLEGSQEGGRRSSPRLEASEKSLPRVEPLNIDENYYGSKSTSQDEAHRWNSDRNAYDISEGAPIKRYPFRVRLRDVHVIWKLFDGYDWQSTRDAITHAVAEVETKAAEKQAKRDKRKSLDVEDDEDSVIGDFLFNSIYIGVGVNQNPRDLARQINRNIDDQASEAESFATTTATATTSASPSRQGFPKSRRRRLRLQRSKQHKMAFELKGVSADVIVHAPGSGETQSSVDIRVQDFDIFDNVPTSTWKKFATYMQDAGERENGASMAHIRILNVKPDPELAASEIVLKATILPLRLHVDQDALDFITRFFGFKDDSAPSQSSPSEQPFIQRAEVNSIPIKLDFKPKRVDYGGLRSGRTTEFMNFIVLDSADMVLRHVIIYGISGFDKLGKTLNDIWMPDVKANQLSGILAGLAPVRSLVNVGSGVRDLVVVPIREYRKDGRVMRSIQKGAMAFAKTTTTELTKLGAKLAIGTQTVLQNAEGVLVPKAESSDAHLSESPPEEKPMISPYADAPVGVMPGLRTGMKQLERDLIFARDAIVAIPGEMMDSGSASGAAKAVLKNAPTVILRPALGVSKAVGQTLMGATSALDKGERRRLDDKYKRR